MTVGAGRSAVARVGGRAGRRARARWPDAPATDPAADRAATAAPGLAARGSRRAAGGAGQGRPCSPRPTRPGWRPATRWWSPPVAARSTGVTVAGAAGEIKGTLDAGRTTWTSKTALAFGTRYTVTAEAANAAGQKTSATSSFTTAKASKQVFPAVSPLRGTTVGVGMPIRVYFDAPVTDRKAALARMKVTTLGADPGRLALVLRQRGALAPEGLLEGRHPGRARHRPVRGEARPRRLRRGRRPTGTSSSPSAARTSASPTPAPTG